MALVTATARMLCQYPLSIRATILVKSPWGTELKPLTQLPVSSYQYETILFFTHSLASSPPLPHPIRVEIVALAFGDAKYCYFSCTVCPNNFVQVGRMLAKAFW